MKTYNLDSVFAFGKYAGKTVRYVVNNDINYFDWCRENMTNIRFADEVWEYIKGDIITGNEACDCGDEIYDEYNYYDNNDYDADTWDALTDGMYGDYPGGDVDYEIFGF